jgi:hypothetical protein
MKRRDPKMSGLALLSAKERRERNMFGRTPLLFEEAQPQDVRSGSPLRKQIGEKRERNMFGCTLLLSYISKKNKTVW